MKYQCDDDDDGRALSLSVRCRSRSLSLSRASVKYLELRAARLERYRQHARKLSRACYRPLYCLSVTAKLHTLTLTRTTQLSRYTEIAKGTRHTHNTR